MHDVREEMCNRNQFSSPGLPGGFDSADARRGEARLGSQGPGDPLPLLPARLYPAQAPQEAPGDPRRQAA